MYTILYMYGVLYILYMYGVLYIVMYSTTTAVEVLLFSYFGLISLNFKVVL